MCVLDMGPIYVHTLTKPVLSYQGLWSFHNDKKRKEKNNVRENYLQIRQCCNNLSKYFVWQLAYFFFLSPDSVIIQTQSQKGLFSVLHTIGTNSKSACLSLNEVEKGSIAHDWAPRQHIHMSRCIPLIYFSRTLEGQLAVPPVYYSWFYLTPVVVVDSITSQSHE